MLQTTVGQLPAPEAARAASLLASPFGSAAGAGGLGRLLWGSALVRRSASRSKDLQRGGKGSPTVPAWVP